MFMSDRPSLDLFLRNKNMLLAANCDLLFAFSLLLCFVDIWD